MLKLNFTKPPNYEEIAVLFSIVYPLELPTGDGV